MKYLKNQLFHTYDNNHDKPIFTFPDLRNNWRKVQKEYPIILSTTFSSLSSLQQDAVFDYIIMDEASQVSVETGALALSCAKNAIIVGDTMQLPNVVTEEDGDIGRAAVWREDYNICIQNHVHKLHSFIPTYTMFYFYAFYFYKSAGYIGGKGIKCSINFTREILGWAPPSPFFMKESRLAIRT